VLLVKKLLQPLIFDGVENLRSRMDAQTFGLQLMERRRIDMLNLDGQQIYFLAESKYVLFVIEVAAHQPMNVRGGGVVSLLVQCPQRQLPVGRRNGRHFAELACTQYAQFFMSVEKVKSVGEFHSHCCW